MKLILVAGATLLTACAAFGFAQAVDRLAAPPQVAAPSPAGFGTERVIPTAPIAPAPAAPAPIAPATIAAPAQAGIAVQAKDTAPAPPAPRLATVAPPADRETHDNAMYFLAPAGASGLDGAGPVRRYDFVNLPVLGVYR
ncbi:hypothetical protein [Paracoccus alkenifer]|uniref:DNA polymerase n=1 Tax=Paracoccus alkenifer TaxID=65735 RepID=A0A1H6JGC7_9RHOB|nr:hypothetical protein [Paracoccus alkenifer]SEH58143.1 DNA polymerase [Paracoccus alkenifer]